MLTTPTPALYMESFGDAAKGKVKAAEREAEKKNKNKKEDKQKEQKMKQETKSSSSDSNSEPASPAQRCRAPTRLRACSRALAGRC